MGFETMQMILVSNSALLVVLFLALNESKDILAISHTSLRRWPTTDIAIIVIIFSGPTFDTRTDYSLMRQ